MKPNIEALVDRIFDHLKQRDALIATRRRAGLDRAYVDEAVRSVGLKAPADLLDLYSYCDGTATSEKDVLGRIQIFPGFYWMSLEDALSSYRGVSRSEKWNSAWLP